MCRSLDAGDVNARVWMRIREIEQSLSLIEQILDAPADGARCTTPLRQRQGCEGLGTCRGVSRRRAGVAAARRRRPRRALSFARPSWFQWPLLEAAIEGNIVADFPLCNKSFNCSYSGHDL